jgi:hypothetical protein
LNDDSVNPRVILTYSFNDERQPTPGNPNPNEELEVIIFQKDCLPGQELSNSEIWPSNPALSTSGLVPADGTAKWDVVLNVNTEAVRANNDGLWGGNPFDFNIFMCVQSKLKARKSASDSWVDIAYDQTKITVRVVLEKEFGPSGIHVVKDNQDSYTQAAKVEYQVNAFECNLNTSNGPPHHPNQMLRICVESDDDRVEINAVKELTLTQDGSAIIKPILDAEPTNPSTTVSKYDNSAGRQYIAVETTLLTEFFFNDPNPGPITIKGVVRMQFPEK